MNGPTTDMGIFDETKRSVKASETGRNSISDNWTGVVWKKLQFSFHIFCSSDEYICSMTEGGTLAMTEPDSDYPRDREAEIRRLIQKHDFEGALLLTIQVFGGEIKRKCIGTLQGYVDDPIAEADELTPKIFLAFYDSLHGYDPAISGISTWLHTIARYKIIDRKRETSRATQWYELVKFEFEHSKLYSPSPEGLVLDRIFLEHVREELAKEFTPLVAAILYLYYFNGKTVTEIAGDLKKAPNNISKRLSLARPQFEKLMAKLRKEI
jgi:RNA polymerase sigma factor (sigma-70 family)